MPKPSGPRAGFWSRLGASFVDGILLWVVMIAIVWPLVGADVADAFRTNDPVEINLAIQKMSPILNLLSLTLPLGYRVWLEGGRRGQTLGKRLFGIRVINLKNGGPIGHGQAALRVICSWVSGIALGFGYLAMLWDDEKQTWHDKWTDSVVVPVSAFPVR